MTIGSRESIQEWRSFMKPSHTWNLRSIVGKIMMGLVFAAMIGSMGVAPALGKNDHGRKGKHDNGRYTDEGRRGSDRDHYDRDRGRWYYHDLRGRRVDRYYHHRDRFYAPPRGFYAPPREPGIEIFFPPIFFPPVIIHP
jgi:hypothetical protein